LYVRPAYLDLGEVWEQDRFPWDLVIENRSKEDIRIRDFSTSCSCLAIEPKSLLVPARKSAAVKLTLKLTTRALGDESVVRNFDVMIRPMAKAVPNPPTWTVRGKVRSAITLTPRLVNFEDRLVRGLSFESQTVMVTSHTPITRLAISSDETIVRVTSRKVDRPTSGFKLAVLPSDTLPEGSFRTEITVQPIALDGALLPAQHLTVDGKVMPDVQPIPTAICFGASKLGETLSETITWRSTSRRPFTFDEIKGTSKELSVKSLGKDMDGNFRFIINLQATELRNQTRVLHFIVRKDSERPIDIPVAASYFGVQ
jgi:hypothetical protein